MKGFMAERVEEKTELLRSFQIPESFYRVIVADISADAWLKLLKAMPHRRDVLFKGYGVRPEKMRRHLGQPEIQGRLRRMLREDSTFLLEILDAWGVEQLKTMVFLEVLDPSYLVDELGNFKDLIGPERFFAALFLLDRFLEDQVRATITPEYWERRMDTDAMQVLLPFAEFCEDLLQQEPQWQDLWPTAAGTECLFGAGSQTAPAAEPKEDAALLRRRLRAAEERQKSVEAKLTKFKEEHRQLQEELQQHRQDQEALRLTLVAREADFEERLEAELDRHRLERWERYQDVVEAPLTEAAGRIENLIRRADLAFQRQRQADEEFGSISSVRQQLLQVNLYLREIERIYADSLVIHADVTRTKEALLRERERILRLPGIERVLRQEPALALPDRLRQRVQLLDPVPANLPRVMQLRELVRQLREGEFTEDAEQLAELVSHKQRQIMETLYARFQQGRQDRAKQRWVRDLDELTGTGASQDYDLFVDGYNILLMVHDAASDSLKASFAALREQFITALVSKSHWFHRIVAVFDGVLESRERHGNVDIVYADRNLGNSADAVIIRGLQKRSSQRTLLVTADREIIEQTARNVYAVIDPCHFYSLLFDLHLPL
jgi:hypothetical protein